MTQRSSTVASLVIGRARKLGASWVREELTATRLHACSHCRYYWSIYDRVINAERRAGFHVLGQIDYSNTWGLGDHGTMPHRDIRRLSRDFAQYAYAVVRHFRSRIQYWEVWNEPDRVAFWHPTPSPGDYARLLSAAYRQIKRANPRVKVVLGGVSGVDLAFLRAVAARTRTFDVVSIHPYRNAPESELLRQIRRLRYLHRPLWFSEIGWAAGGECSPCPTEDSQADFLVRFYGLAAAAGVQRVFWYDLRDDALAGTSPEDHFGLMQYDLTAKPAFLSYAVLSRLLRGSRFVGSRNTGLGGIYVLRFASRDGPVALLWNTGRRARRVYVPWTAAVALAVATDGSPISGTGVQHRTAFWTIQPGGQPIYLLSRSIAFHLMQPGPLLRFPPTLRPHWRKVKGRNRGVRPASRPRHGRRLIRSSGGERSYRRRAGSAATSTPTPTPSPVSTPTTPSEEATAMPGTTISTP